MASENLYEILGVSETAPKGEIKKRYRKLVHVYHPDKQPPGASEDAKKRAEEKFKQISSAWSTLSDDKKRSEYDNSCRRMKEDEQRQRRNEEERRVRREQSERRVAEESRRRDEEKRRRAETERLAREAEAKRRAEQAANEAAAQRAARAKTAYSSPSHTSSRYTPPTPPSKSAPTHFKPKYSSQSPKTKKSVLFGYIKFIFLMFPILAAASITAVKLNEWNEKRVEKALTEQREIAKIKKKEAEEKAKIIQAEQEKKRAEERRVVAEAERIASDKNYREELQTKEEVYIFSHIPDGVGFLGETKYLIDTFFEMQIKEKEAKTKTEKMYFAACAKAMRNGAWYRLSLGGGYANPAFEYFSQRKKNREKIQSINDIAKLTNREKFYALMECKGSERGSEYIKRPLSGSIICENAEKFLVSEPTFCVYDDLGRGQVRAIKIILPDDCPDRYKRLIPKSQGGDICKNAVDDQ